MSNSEQPKFEKQELEGENEKSNKTTNFKNNKSKDSRRQVKKETIAKRKNRDVASKNVEKKQNKGNHKQSTQPQEVIPTKADTSGLVIAQAKIDPEIPDQIRLEIMDQLQLLIQMYRKKAGYHDEETGAFSEDYMNFMDRYYSGETVLYNDMDEVPQDLHMEHINYRDRIYSNMSSSGLRFSLFEMKLMSVYSDPLDKYHYKAEIHFKKQMFNMIRNNVNVVDAPGDIGVVATASERSVASSAFNRETDQSDQQKFAPDHASLRPMRRSPSKSSSSTSRACRFGRDSETTETPDASTTSTAETSRQRYTEMLTPPGPWSSI